MSALVIREDLSIMMCRLPHHGDEPSTDSQGNGEGSKKGNASIATIMLAKTKNPQHDNADSRENKHQEGCSTKKDRSTPRPFPHANRPILWSRHWLPVDYDCDSIALKEQPPRNYCEHKYGKSNCQFHGHKHFL
jgi:hypothetical protein